MRALRHHACLVLGSPWPGVFATDIDSARAYGRHWHATFGMGVMVHGGHRSASGRGTVEAHAGDVITSNPGEVHDGRPLGDAPRRWRMVYVEPEVLASIADGEARTRFDVQLTRPVIRDARLAGALRRLSRRLERWSASALAARRAPNTGGDGRVDETLACEESLVLACGLALRAHSTPPPIAAVRPDVRQARERLADDLATTPSLGELASLVGVSRYQLLRRFERAYGLTPHQWLRQLRVERARASIARGTRLAEASVECGFADQSHMTRAFVHHFGFTPGVWQRAHAPAAFRRG